MALPDGAEFDAKDAYAQVLSSDSAGGRIWPAVVVVGDGQGELVVRTADEEGVAVAARLPLDGATAGDERAAFVLDTRGMNGAGGSDTILHVTQRVEEDGQWHDRFTVIFFEGGHSAEAAREVIRFDEPLLVTDTDGDGAYEVVTSGGPKRWEVRRATDRFAVSEVVEDDPGPGPPEVVDGALPALPASLWFQRDEAIVLWDRDGGALETVWAPGADGWTMPAARTKPYVPRLLEWRVARASGHLAVGQDAPGDADLEARIAVLDPSAGAWTFLPLPGSLVSRYRWDLTADGQWLVYLDYGPADGDLRDRSATLWAASTADPTSRREVARCTVYDPPSKWHDAHGCMGMLVAPDGETVSYSDGRGLWIASIHRGEPRLLREHFFGESEVDVGIMWPRAWSPDGSKLLVEVGGYEGTGRAILDTGGGSLEEIPDSNEYARSTSELAWLPDGTGLVHARTNDFVPLWLVPADDPDAARALLPVRNLGPTSSLHSIAPFVAPEGEIRFALRRRDNSLYRGNGIFAVDTGGAGWRRVAPLPPVTQTNPDETLEQTGVVMWSPDGAAWLSLNAHPEWAAVTGAAWLGAADGSAVWDASGVLEGSWFATWGP